MKARFEPLTIGGVMVPRLLYGTAWKEERTEQLVSTALACGFRGIDSANQRKHYFEAATGRAVQAAIARGELGREELFLQTKFTYRRGQDQRLPYDPKASLPEQVRQSLESSLAHFGTTYVDSLLLHGPATAARWTSDDEAVWGAMEELCSAGRVRLLGVSNVALPQLEALCSRASIKPSFVQNRCFASTGWDREVRRFCRENFIVYQGFSLLTANRTELSQGRVTHLLSATGLSLAQLVFAFALHAGMLPLTGTSQEAHMKLDLSCVGLALADDVVQELERIV